MEYAGGDRPGTVNVGGRNNQEGRRKMIGGAEGGLHLVGLYSEKVHF